MFRFEEFNSLFRIGRITETLMALKNVRGVLQRIIRKNFTAAERLHLDMPLPAL